MRPLQINRMYLFFKQLYENTSNLELLLISFNFLFILGGQRVFKSTLKTFGLEEVVQSQTQETQSFKTFRRFNLLVLLLALIQIGTNSFTQHDLWIPRLLSVFLVISVSYFSNLFVDLLIRRQFGKKKSSDNKNEYQDTYRSRLLSLVSTILIVILALVMSIRFLGFQSILETGGVLGIIGVILALTQGSWAPDLISGLIILNSGLIEEGDVVELPSHSLMGVVFKTKMFHTEFLSLSNNHRVMISNAQLRQESIHNLSKFASAKGLRESLSFKIGYDTPFSQVHDLFQSAFETLVSDATLEVLSQYPLEIRVDDAGDYAIKWTIFYYIKDLKKCLTIRQGFCKQVVMDAPHFNVSLATPILYQRVEGETPFELSDSVITAENI